MVQDGVEIHGIHEEGQGSPVELTTFPCIASALCFFLVSRDYEWESSSYQSLIVKLSSSEFETAKARFYNPSEVTPSNVMDHFPMSVSI